MSNNYRGHPRSTHIHQAQKSNLKLVTNAPPSSPLPFQYFADQFNRWPFFTGEVGKSMLEFMDIYRQRALLLCDEQIDFRLDHEGRDIYERKPNKNESVVTWSQNDYSHVGFQRRYIELKSIQRFTEMYSFLERAMLNGALDKWIKRPVAADIGAENVSSVLSTSDAHSSPEAVLDQGEETMKETDDTGSTEVNMSKADKDIAYAERADVGKQEMGDSEAPIGEQRGVTESEAETEVKSKVDNSEESKSTSAFKKKIRIVSIGGGPGFELIACKAFFKKHAPDVTVDVITLDYMSGWRVYNELFNIEFHEYDMLASEPSLDSLIGDREVDIYLFSYVFFHYFRTNEHLEKILSLTKPHPTSGENPAVYVLERSENMNTLDRLVELSNIVHVDEPSSSSSMSSSIQTTEGSHDMADSEALRANADNNSTADANQIRLRIPVSVVKVIDQKLGRDDRQCIILAASEAQKFTPWQVRFDPTYPNVPYEEHKLKAKANWGQRKPHNNNLNYSRDHQRNQYPHASSRGRYDSRKHVGNASHQDMTGHDSNARRNDDAYSKKSNRGRSRSRDRSRERRRGEDRFDDRDREKKRSSSYDRGRGRQRDSERSQSRSRSRSRDRSSRSSRSNRRRYSKSRSRSVSRSRSKSRSRSRSKSRSHKRRYRSRSRDKDRSRSRSRSRDRKYKSSSRSRREGPKDNGVEGKESNLLE